MNPMLIYTILQITLVVVEVVIGSSYEMDIILLAVLLPVVTVIAVILYIKGKAISTTKVAAAIIIVVVGLAAGIIPFL